MKVRLLEPVTLRSEPLLAGAEIDVDDITADQLIAAGHAEAVAAVNTPKTQKTQPQE